MKKITQSEFEEKVKLHRLWREDHSDGVRLVLTGCILTGIDFSGCNFRGSDLSYCNLLHCDLRNSDMRHCNLSYGNLRHCDLRNSDMRNCNLSYCNLSGSDMRGSDLSDSDLTGCNLDGCDLTDAIIPSPAAPIATPKGPQTRQGILDTARSHVSKDRESTSESPEDSFGVIAEYWETHLGHPVKATDVAIMMALLKVARLRTTPTSLDSWVDLAGYAACGGEIAMKDKTDA